MKKKISFAVYLLLLIVFMPVLGAIIFVGNKMDYYEGLKLPTLLPNLILALIALAGMGICGYLIRICRKAELTFRKNLIADGIFAVLFVLLYFINVRVAREVVFELPWDIMIVRGTAYQIAHKEALGYFPYLSIYPNNIPISYILGRIFRSAEQMGKTFYETEFVWIQVNCMLISLGGFFSCLLVKKITKKLMPAIITFFLYLVLAGMSMWKIAPYTDIYSIVFPVMCIYFYFCYRDADKIRQKCLFILLTFAAAGAGGFIKPSIYLLFIAVLGSEFIRLISEKGKNWIFLLGGALLAVALLFAAKVYTNHIIEEIGLEYNEELEASWHHYFYMGLNERTTGGYNTDDTTLFGEFQTSKKERREAQLERAFGRMKERGVWGSLYFWFRKLVMTFNDGRFGWTGEVWVDKYFPANFASNTPLTEWLRSIYWNGANTGRYNTLCQLAWIFCLLCIPGICLGHDERTVILAVSFLGLFFYQMLLEARARYLLAFLPLLIATAVCGLWRYVTWAEGFFQGEGGISRKVKLWRKSRK
ncbi:MAG: hypothetical protein NC123_07360 [Butyrivibrio sp.]|nr:hypothetical protein [Acetatifactor muris]MCM1559347.1 hypothetical protein [Butyrivibrio sp.]